MKDTMDAATSQPVEMSDAEKARLERIRGEESRDRMAADREIYLAQQDRITTNGKRAVSNLTPTLNNGHLLSSPEMFIKHVYYIEAKGNRVVVLPCGVAGGEDFSKPGALKGAYIGTCNNEQHAIQLAADLKAYRRQQVPPPIIPKP